MKILVTRVSKAAVSVFGKDDCSITKGLVCFIGLEVGDAASELKIMANKIANLRIFEDEAGKMNFSSLDKNYEILAVSNFTLCADTSHGRRPSFDSAMASVQAGELFKQFVSFLEQEGLTVKTGSFGQHMDIKLAMDGPVNVLL